MPRTIEGVVAWTRDPANRNRHQGGNWHNRCQQYINNAGDFNSSFDTAWLAGQASGPLTKSLAGIQNGAVGYWRGVWIDGEECGHDAFWFNGAWWMASDACGEARTGLGERIGNGTGWITHAEYARLRPAAIWQGWSLRHGTETLSRSALAGGNLTPIFESGDDMKIIKQPNGTIALIGEHDTKVYTSMSQAFSIGANGKVWGVIEGLTGDEVTTLVNEAKARRSALIIDVAAAIVKALPATTGGVINYAALAKAVNDDAAKRLAN